MRSTNLYVCDERNQNAAQSGEPCRAAPWHAPRVSQCCSRAPTSAANGFGGLASDSTWPASTLCCSPYRPRPRSNARPHSPSAIDDHKDKNYDQYVEHQKHTVSGVLRDAF